MSHWTTTTYLEDGNTVLDSSDSEARMRTWAKLQVARPEVTGVMLHHIGFRGGEPVYLHREQVYRP